MLPSEFEHSTANPRRLATIKCTEQHDDEKTKHNHYHKKNEPWYDKLIISEANKFYIVFNTAVTIFMLLSSYYYGFLAANRFHLIDVHENDKSYFLRE